MTDSSPSWQILALRYAQNTQRTRKDSFVDASNPNASHPMDFYFWVLRKGDDVVVVDTGMDGAEGQRRGRPITREPMDMLHTLGIAPENVKTLVITHLHFDHAGCLEDFPNAQVHIQAAELDFVHSDALQDPAIAFPYSRHHIDQFDAIAAQGRAVIHNGDADIADGVSGHLIGGHASGLMALKVRTQRTTKLLASDVAHYYESVTHRPIFQIVVDRQKMLDGYVWAADQVDGFLCRLIPAHDPKLRDFYPEIAPDVFDVSGKPGPAFVNLEVPIEWRNTP